MGHTNSSQVILHYTMPVNTLVYHASDGTHSLLTDNTLVYHGMRNLFIVNTLVYHASGGTHKLLTGNFILQVRDG